MSIRFSILYITSAPAQVFHQLPVCICWPWPQTYLFPNMQKQQCHQNSIFTSTFQFLKEAHWLYKYQFVHIVMSHQVAVLGMYAVNVQWYWVWTGKLQYWFRHWANSPSIYFHCRTTNQRMHIGCSDIKIKHWINTWIANKPKFPAIFCLKVS